MKILGYGKKSESVDVELKQKEEEMKLVSDIIRKFEDSRLVKASKVAMWDKCVSAYNSDYFKSPNKPDYKSDEMSNYIFSTIETIKPIMVDNDPKFNILPKTPKGVLGVDKIQKMFNNEWRRAKMGKKLVQAITVALQIGTAIFYVPWDAKDENGLGNTNPVLINPYNLFPDPMATCKDDAEFLIYATYKHVNQLKQLFPSKANLLESGTINYQELVSLGQDTSSVTNQVLVLECYMRDYATYEYEEQDESGKAIKKRARKYPKGRVVTACPELDIVLDDKPLAYEDGDFPFIILKCYDVPFDFWGQGEIEQLLSPQKYINELTNQIIDNAKLTANMPWIVDKNSGIGKGVLTNRPGLVIRKNPGTMIERKQPPQMPNYVREMIETLKRDIEVISGVHDITQGRKPGSVSAASAIIALQEAAQARIRLKVKLMEFTLSELGQMWYNRNKQYWVTSRYVRLSNENENTEFTEITPEDLQEEVDFSIEAGSTMPNNKVSMLDLMIRLAQTMGEDGLPMVNRESVLAYTDVPNKREVINQFSELTNQNKAQEQEAMMQQQAMQMAQQEHGANMEKTRHTNEEVTDAQLQQVVQMLIQNPEMLQAIMQQQNTQSEQPI